MPVLATLIKVAALATMLTFFGAARPMPDKAALQCRLYFGCAPARN
jgi:hypothetical protein